jgi:hypothetical protein
LMPNFHPPQVLSALRTQGITTLVTVPAMLAMLIAALPHSAKDSEGGSEGVWGGECAGESESAGESEREEGRGKRRARSVFAKVETVLVGGQPLPLDCFAAAQVD